MNLTAATITVYFVGLINFHGTGDKRDVILPLTPAGTIYHGKTLEPHHADVVVRGLTEGKKGCDALLGVWVELPSPEKPTCTVANISKKSITLPSSSAKFDATPPGAFNRIPKLTHLCSGLGDPVDVTYPTQHAALLTITSGKLDACLNGNAWVSNLTLINPTGDLDIGGNHASLKNDAVVVIRNVPVPPVPGVTHTQEQHFWWYYVLYQDTGPCGETTRAGLPLSETEPACPAAVVAYFRTASGVGCSNTGYP